jgi:EEF1A N-terminal glycine/lysine methyltransferase
VWGASVEKLVAHLPEEQRKYGFDIIILADLVFNHSEHEKLVKTLQQTLSRTNACALVFFTPYRPWLLEKDLSFFEKAEEGGFQVEKIVEKVMDKVLFENDPGVCLLSMT